VHEIESNLTNELDAKFEANVGCKKILEVYDTIYGSNHINRSKPYPLR
jgi:hypothetical protein